jgi:hypothetical protein
LARSCALDKKAATASCSLNSSIKLEARERRVDQRQIWELRHAAGGRYFDFTPVMIVTLASIVGARYLAIGTGDTELYLFAGMRAAVVISIRVFRFRGRARRMGAEPPIRHTVHHRQPSANGAVIHAGRSHRDA